MAKWFYLTAGQQRGPIEPAALKHLATTDQLKPTDKVRREDMAVWYDAKRVKGLFPPNLSEVSASFATPTAMPTPTAAPAVTLKRKLSTGKAALKIAAAACLLLGGMWFLISPKSQRAPLHRSENREPATAKLVSDAPNQPEKSSKLAAKVRAEIEQHSPLDDVTTIPSSAHSDEKTIHIGGVKEGVARGFDGYNRMMMLLVFETGSRVAGGPRQTQEVAETILAKEQVMQSIRSKNLDDLTGRYAIQLTLHELFAAPPSILEKHVVNDFVKDMAPDIRLAFLAQYQDVRSEFAAHFYENSIWIAKQAAASEIQME